MEEKQKSSLKKITVYASPELKEEMERYKEEKHFSSLSSMLRMGFTLMKQVLGTDSSKPNEPTLAERLEGIETKIEEVKSELVFLGKQQEEIDNEFDSVPVEIIPNFKIISEKILSLISELDGIKDFVIMEHLRNEYSEGIIWASLMKLKNMKKIKLVNGEWKLNGN